MKSNQHQDRQVAKLLLEIFSHTRFAKAKLSTDNMVSYSPAIGELTEEHLLAHLKGELVLGSYALTDTNLVWWMGWDVDSNDMETAKEYALKIVGHLEDIPHCIEFSGGKGYHILIFLSEPMQAVKAKQIADFIRDKEGLPRSGKSHVECYPKQTKLTQANPLGNLLKIPLGRHPRTNSWSVFVDQHNGWEGGPPVNPLEVLGRRIDPVDLDQLLEEEQGDAITQIASLIAPIWQTGERHSLALNLSGYLANIGWGAAMVGDLIQKICQNAGDDEVKNRIDAVDDTFQKIAQGEKVAGYTYLADTLPGMVMTQLMEISRTVAAPPLMKKLEVIRFSKGPNWQKVRQSADIIWAHLGETGIVMKTRNNQLYWYDADTHLITDLMSESWLAHVHKFYGLNPAEAFGRQVTRSIELKANTDGAPVEVYTRSYWDGARLFVNLGGPEVYILDGNDEIEMGYNGDCGVIFTASHTPRAVPIPDFETTEDAWKYLTDDLNFATTEDASAKPEEQQELLKAWILAFFFPQLMETKPILCALGSPGSGKTSMMRRIVRILEGPYQDVITLSEDKPDSIRASIEDHKLLVLDNLEHSKASWLVNLLNTLSTGSVIELRTLFRTNEVYRIEPQVFVALTAVDIPFSESTLHSRLLPIELAQISNVIPETVLQRRIRQNQEKIWGSLLWKLNGCVKELRNPRKVNAPIQSRLADFTVFCARISGAGVLKASVLEKGLMNLIDRQRAQMLQSSPIIEILDDYVNSQPEDACKWHSYGELMTALGQIANKRRIYLERVTTAASLKRHLQPRMPALAKAYGAEIRQVTGQNGKKVEQVKFPQPFTLDFTKKENSNGHRP